MSRWEDGEVIETSEDGRFRLRIVPDQDSLNPRENGDYVTHITSPVNHDYIKPEDDEGPYAHIMRHLDNQYRSHDACEMFVRAVTMLGGAAYLFDSAGYRGSPSLHVIYLTKEAIEKELADGRKVQPDWTFDPMDWLKSEAQEYTNWAVGDVYGFVIEENVVWVREDQADLPAEERESMAVWDVIESGFGFYFHETAVEDGTAEFNAIVAAAQK